MSEKLELHQIGQLVSQGNTVHITSLDISVSAKGNTFSINGIDLSKIDYTKTPMIQLPNIEDQTGDIEVELDCTPFVWRRKTPSLFLVDTKSRTGVGALNQSKLDSTFLIPLFLTPDLNICVLHYATFADTRSIICMPRLLYAQHTIYKGNTLNNANPMEFISADREIRTTDTSKTTSLFMKALSLFNPHTDLYDYAEVKSDSQGNLLSLQHYVARYTGESMTQIYSMKNTKRVTTYLLDCDKYNLTKGHGIASDGYLPRIRVYTNLQNLVNLNTLRNTLEKNWGNLISTQKIGALFDLRNAPNEILSQQLKTLYDPDSRCIDGCLIQMSQLEAVGNELITCLLCAQIYKLVIIPDEQANAYIEEILPDIEKYASITAQYVRLEETGEGVCTVKVYKNENPTGWAPPKEATYALFKEADFTLEAPNFNQKHLEIVSKAVYQLVNEQ